MDSAGAEPLFFVLCHRDHGGGGGGDLDPTQKSSQYVLTSYFSKYYLLLEKLFKYLLFSKMLGRFRHLAAAL